MGIPGGLEIALIVFVVILLFGAKKIPDLATGLGKGIKNFKKEMKTATNEIKEATKEVEEVKTEVKEIETEIKKPS